MEKMSVGGEFAVETEDCAETGWVVPEHAGCSIHSRIVYYAEMIPEDEHGNIVLKHTCECGSEFLADTSDVYNS